MDEDSRGGFRHGGWAAAGSDETVGRILYQLVGGVLDRVAHAAVVLVGQLGMSAKRL
jgi:hypothetical protein